MTSIRLPEPKDSRGITLREGQRVAYNRSGNVIAGTIIGVGREIRIEPDPEFRAYIKGPSRVKNYRSILVLFNVVR